MFEVSIMITEIVSIFKAIQTYSLVSGGDCSIIFFKYAFIRLYVMTDELASPAWTRVIYGNARDDRQLR